MTKQSWKKHLSSDSKIILALRREQPLTFEGLREKTGLISSQLYAALPLLKQQGIIKNLEEEKGWAKGKFVLSDFKPMELEIKKLLKFALELYFRLMKAKGEIPFSLAKYIYNSLMPIVAMGLGVDPNDIEFRETFARVVGEFMKNPTEFVEPSLIESLKNKVLQDLIDEFSAGN